MLFVVRPDVEGVAHLRDRLAFLRDQVDLGGPDGPPVGVAAVTSYRDTRSAPDLQQLLDSEGLAGPGARRGGRRRAHRRHAARGRLRPRLAVPADPLGRRARRPPPRARGVASRRPDAGVSAMDQQLVRSLREEVAEVLARQRREDAANGLPAMTCRGRAAVRPCRGQPGPRRLRPRRGHRRPQAAHPRGGAAPRRGHPRRPVRRRPPAAAARRPEVENIDINGCDNVFIGYADGREERGAPVADNDDELVELVQVLGAYSGLTSRPFDTANPQLDIRLPDGSRLSAVMGVCQRPSLSIRRARISRASLDMLVDYGLDLARAGRLPLGGRAGAQEHHDRRRDQRRQDHAAAGAGQRDRPGRAAGHRRAGARARARRVRGPAPQRRRLRGAAAQLRGPRRDPHGRAGAPLAADEPLAGSSSARCSATRSSPCSTR